MTLKKVLIILLAVILVSSIIYHDIIYSEKIMEDRWARKIDFTQLDSTAFLLDVDILNKFEGILIVNNLYYTHFAYCTEERICFDDFITIGDKLSYNNKENLIEIFRSDSTYIFPKYLEPEN